MHFIDFSNMTLKKKKILIGISSSIAVKKVPLLISLLKDKGADIEVVATKNALKLINKKEIEKVLGKKIWFNMFSENSQFSVLSSKFSHVDLAKWADVFLIAPATANLIGKIANGLADDLLSTLLLVYQGDLFIAPAMNCNMWNNFFVQQNLNKLIDQCHSELKQRISKSNCFYILDPQKGKLACGDEGIGRMMEPADIILNLENYFEERNLLKAKKMLITAGATREYLDPVRYITNGSSGKMGMALAQEACRMGAEVILVYGMSYIVYSIGTFKTINVETTEQMFEAVKNNIEGCDAFISAAAVCDFKPINFSEKKIKKEDSLLELRMICTHDILNWAGKYRSTLNKKNTKSSKLIANSLQLKIIGFALETENIIENARKKLKEKNADLMIANGPSNIDSDEGEFYFVNQKTAKRVKGSKNEAAKEILKQLLPLWC